MPNNINSNMPQGTDKAKILQSWRQLSPAEQDSIRKINAEVDKYFNEHKSDKNLDKVSVDDILKGDKDKVEEKRTNLPDGGILITQKQNGKEIGKLYYDAVGNLLGSEHFEYDRKGNVKKETINRGDGTVKQITEYKNGETTRILEYNEAGNLESRTEYDNGGMFSKPKVTVYRGDGTKESEIIQDGENSKEIHYAEDGKTVISEE